MRLALLFPLLSPLTGCGHTDVTLVEDTAPDADADTDADTDADSDADADSDTDTDTDNGMDDTIVLPGSPLPFTLTLAGAVSETATFDTVTCVHPPNNQFQLSFTNAENTYSWYLRVYVREPFTGAGTYSTTVQVQLTENFAGGGYYAASTSEGAAVELTVDAFGTNGAYGSLTTDALSGEDGDVRVTPQPIPFWCDAISE